MEGGDTIFPRCPRCRKTWAGYSVYRCPSCATVFCACCHRDEPGARELRWLATAAAESGLANCPVCTAEITEDDAIGVIGPTTAQ